MSNIKQLKSQRIEKELKLLRNLPKEYKIGKRDTSLGTLLYVMIYPVCLTIDCSLRLINQPSIVNMLTRALKSLTLIFY